ncbi:hypothetical protein EBR66_04860 [bacterium]|nr:hypothetical protein [bacterium]
MNTNPTNTVSTLTLVGIILCAVLGLWLFQQKLAYDAKQSRTSAIDLHVPDTESVRATAPSTIQNTSQEEINTYVTRVEDELHKVSPESTEARLLLIRKAAAMSLPRDVSFDRANLAETLDIFKTIIFAPESPNDLAKRIGIVAFARMFDQWCFDSRGISPLTYNVAALSDPYKNHARSYKKNSQVNTMFAVSDFLDSYADDTVLRKDTIYLAVTSKIDAILFRSFGKTLQPDDRRTILTRLGRNLERMPFSQYTTFRSGKPGELSEKDLQFAIANDIFESYKGVDVDNAKIDEGYKKLFTGLNEYAGKDVMTANMFRSIATVYYVDSLKRRYGDTKEAEVQKLISDFLKTMNTNPTISRLMAAYFRDGLYGGSTWEPMKNNFISLSNDNKDLKKYFISVGIPEKDIVGKKNDWSAWKI